MEAAFSKNSINMEINFFSIPTAPITSLQVECASWVCKCSLLNKRTLSLAYRELKHFITFLKSTWNGKSGELFIRETTSAERVGQRRIFKLENRNLAKSRASHRSELNRTEFNDEFNNKLNIKFNLRNSIRLEMFVQRVFKQNWLRPRHPFEWFQWNHFNRLTVQRLWKPRLETAALLNLAKIHKFIWILLDLVYSQSTTLCHKVCATLTQTGHQPLAVLDYQREATQVRTLWMTFQRCSCWRLEPSKLFEESNSSSK